MADKILIVDDDAEIREVLRVLLTGEGVRRGGGQRRGGGPGLSGRL